MTNKLEQLKTMTTVVADTGDIDAIAKWRPEDATTNPSLLLKAAASDAYRPMLDQAVADARRHGGSSAEQLTLATDTLAVLAGREILNLIPGVVSTEVDARLSFDTNATLDRARRLVDLYDRQGVDTNRVLIKIASTWEGIRAAEQLEKEGIRCNLTLLFSFIQAAACAQAIDEGVHSYRHVKAITERLVAQALAQLDVEPTATALAPATPTQAHDLIRDPQEYSDLFAMAAAATTHQGDLFA